MKWLHVDTVRTTDQAAIFLVTRRDAIDFTSLLAALEQYRAECEAPDKLDPHKLSEIARDIVAQTRPELAGCTIWFVGFDPYTLGWEIGVSHGSLPQVSPGEMLQKFYLFEREYASVPDRLGPDRQR